jgi:hypothetical protein
MKTFQTILIALTWIAFISCGGYSKKDETHNHGSECPHIHEDKALNDFTEQESFTVETDSTLCRGTDSVAVKKSEPHQHNHNDGKVHTH